jgi:glycosyltransferase involved in cell wall biosynthesis
MFQAPRLKDSITLNKTPGYSILVIELEPTPYKTDRWNAFSDSAEIEVFVVYTEQKNWAPDSGHNYKQWPKRKYNFVVLSGKNILGKLSSAIRVVSILFRNKTNLVVITGYDRLSTITAIIWCLLKGQQFMVQSDEFNNNWPKGMLGSLKLPVREAIRKLVFRLSVGVLVCGKRGVESAFRAGCALEKILDFPYVIDVKRLRTDLPQHRPVSCLQDVHEGKVIIFFSGRMIPRKGLATLLAALQAVTTLREWVLWIEGDGPERLRYERLALQLNIDVKCRFIGFCQYDLHSWLIRTSDIVVVPSLEDPWAIVVDEGLQLGKAVIASSATGAGYDRICHGYSGYLFPSENTKLLAKYLERLIDNDIVRIELGKAAASSSKNIRPQDNREALLMHIKNCQEDVMKF